MSRLILRTCVLLATLLLWNGVSVSATSSFVTLINTQSNVTVKVTPRVMQGDILEFDVVFDTHSQQLTDDLLKNATLVPAGASPIPPLEWKADPPGGHHRKGVLRFGAIKPVPTDFELRIDRPGEQNARVFHWSLR